MTTKICPRCETSFNCNTENITQCQCYTVSISEATQEHLRKTSYDCLCADCLKELNKLTDFAENNPLPRDSNLIKNVHYYIDNELFVFTELYLMQRGYCCKNGCRHCAYGYKNTDPNG